VFVATIFLLLILRKALFGLGECLRADAAYRGPIHDHLSNIVGGLVTIRKYERSNYFNKVFIRDLEKSTNVIFSYYTINRWIAVHLDAICLLFATGAACFAIFMKDEIPSEVLAFSLQLLAEVIMFFSVTLRFAAEVESYFLSAPRLYKYT